MKKTQTKEMTNETLTNTLTLLYSEHGPYPENVATYYQVAYEVVRETLEKIDVNAIGNAEYMEDVSWQISNKSLPNGGITVYAVAMMLLNWTFRQAKQNGYLEELPQIPMHGDWN